MLQTNSKPLVAVQTDSRNRGIDPTSLSFLPWTSSATLLSFEGIPESAQRMRFIKAAYALLHHELPWGICMLSSIPVACNQG